ncbi:MAG: T9SS type A sorting domain-containing protein [Calditrichaeota bacterium]|nr:T9SS type A sorting domain-containing protein [Calditrichota bacterium]
MFKCLFRKSLSSFKYILIPSADEDREISVRPARLYALVGFLCFVALAPEFVFAQTEIMGEVSGEWNAEGNPYIVLDSTWVPEGEVLSIGSGVVVTIEEDVPIVIFGRLEAEGSEEDSIFFRSVDEDQLWRSIFLLTPHIRHHFSFCSVKDVYRFIRWDDDVDVTIEDSNITSESSITTALSGMGLSEGHELIAERSVFRILINDYAFGGLHASRFEATDCVIETDNRGAIDAPFGRLTLVNCEVRGGIFSYSGSGTYYRDCTLICNRIGDDYSGHFVITGREGGMVNCIVSGKVKTSATADGIISDSEITGMIEFDLFQGQVINSTIIGLDNFPFSRKIYIDDDNDIEFKNCNLFGTIRVEESSNVSIDSSIITERFYMTGNPERNRNHQAIIQHSVLIGRLSIDHGNMNFINNTIVYPEIVGRTEAIIDLHQNRQEINFFNNIVYAIPDSSSLFRFRVQDFDDVNISNNCFYGYGYLLEAYHRRGGDEYELNETNITEDPLFLSLDSLDLHLLEDSPCIDTGDPNSPLDPDSTRADMGAFYFPQPNLVEGFEFLIPQEIIFLSPYPNPFNGSFKQQLKLEISKNIGFKLYDINGRVMIKQNPQVFPSGNHVITIDGQGLANGTYFLSIQSDNSAHTVQVELLK